LLFLVFPDHFVALYFNLTGATDIVKTHISANQAAHSASNPADACE
jgi:hypothetical protein